MKSPSIEEIKRWHDEEDRFLSEKIKAGDTEDVRISKGKGMFSGRFDRLSKEDKAWLIARSSLMTSIKSHPQHHYLTGLTALNIVNAERPPAFRQTNEIQNIDSWQVACHNIDSTQALLGMIGVHEVTETIYNEVGDIGFGGPIYAADYERAVFDLVGHFIVNRDQLPSLQARDIKCNVDLSVVQTWLHRFEPQAVEKVKAWMRAE